MRTVRHAALCGLILLAMIGCGSNQPSGSTPATGTPTATTPAADDGASSASVVKARATISADGLEFVGADAARIGDTVQVSVTNQESGPVQVRILNPAGTAVRQVEVNGGSTGQISTTVDVAGTWTVAFDDHVGSGGLTGTISVR